MANSEIKSLSTEDLKVKLAEVEKAYEDLRFTHSVSSLSNPSTLGNLRRDIARIKTELRQRELTVLTESGQAPKRDKIRARRKKEKKH